MSSVPFYSNWLDCTQYFRAFFEFFFSPDFLDSMPYLHSKRLIKMNFDLNFCLVCSGYYIVNYHRLGDLKQENFISHSPDGWKVQNKALAYSVSDENSLSGSQRVISSRKGQESSLDLFYKGTNTIHEGSTLMT